MLVAVVFLHKLPQRDSHSLSVKPIIGLQEPFKDLLEGVRIASADIVCIPERAMPVSSFKHTTYNRNTHSNSWWVLYNFYEYYLYSSLSCYINLTMATFTSFDNHFG